MSVHIGTSGWSYDHWNGVLYPQGTPPYHRLSFYLEKFSTVELNSSYYRWPRLSTFKSWRKRLPEGFLMTVKAPRGLTHAKKLYGPEKWLQTIQAGWHGLLDRRGILLVQLSPLMTYDYERLAYFLDKIPWWMRTAVEMRHPSWHREEVFQLLEQHQTAYCIMSGAYLPCILRTTAPFVYARLHGPDHHHLYGGSYSDDDLGWWAERINEWQCMGKEVFVYFNNDGGGNAVRNALRLKEFVES